MNITGKIKVIFDKQTFSSGFEKREVVVTTDEKYPQDIKIEFIKDKCGILDNYSVGQEVDIAINLRGNEYNGNYYVNLVGWKIEAGTGISEKQEMQKNAIQPAKEFEGDDIPF